MKRKPASPAYPRLTAKILEGAPPWDDTRAATPLLREMGRRFGLTLREFLLWHALSDARQRDRRVWAKTTPRLLRDWFMAVKAEMERHVRPPDPAPGPDGGESFEGMNGRSRAQLKRLGPGAKRGVAPGMKSRLARPDGRSVFDGSKP